MSNCKYKKCKDAKCKSSNVCDNNDKNDREKCGNHYYKQDDAYYCDDLYYDIKKNGCKRERGCYDRCDCLNLRG